MLSCFLGINKQTGASLDITGAFCFLFNLLPVHRMFIHKRHVRQWLSFPRKGRRLWNRPFFAAIFISLLKSLPYKITGCKRKGQGNIREIRSCDQRIHPRRAHSHNANFAIAVSLQPFDRCLDSF